VKYNNEPESRTSAERGVDSGIELSLVLPLPPGQPALGALMTAVRVGLADIRCPTEIVIVDDGGDGTVKTAVARWRSHFDGLIVARHDRRRGRGAAARTGVIAARGKYVVVTDPDLALPLQNVSLLLESLRSGADVAIVSRRMPGMELFDERPFLERAAETTVHALSQLVVPVGVRDSLSGLRGFRTRAAKKVADRARVSGAAFGVEWLALAQFFGFQIVECPIEWVRGPLLGQRGKTKQSALELLGDLWKTRKRLAGENYEGSVTPRELLHETSFVRLDREQLTGHARR
jgi:dolichyl-phosphate beta-glucosyltransferase